MTSIAVAIVRNNDDRYLLIRRHQAVGQHAWVFPGGKIEYSETPVRAAQREVREETGVRCLLGQSQIIETRVHPNTGVLAYYVMFGSCRGTPSAREPEKIDSAAWFTAEQVIGMLGNDLAPNVRAILPAKWKSNFTKSTVVENSKIQLNFFPDNFQSIHDSYDGLATNS